jgi:hypothetical protein
LDGAFALQEEIARSIVDALKVKLGVQVSAHEQACNNVYDLDLRRLFTDVTPLAATNSIGIGVPVQTPSNSFTVPDYTSAGDFDARRPDTRVTAAPPETAFNASARDRGLEASLRTNKVTAAVAAAPPETGSNTSARDRALEPGLRTNKIRTDVTPAPLGTGVATSERYHASEAAPRTNKIRADGSAFIQGFVKDAKGEPIKGADVRIESRNGKQVFSTVKTDPKGRYVSQGLEAGVYRVTLLVNGAVKSSVMNTQTKANQPTQLNFDFKPASQAGNIAKGKKHMVWVPNRTGSHLGGTWVEVDDKGNEHSESNMETYTARRW